MKFIRTIYHLLRSLLRLLVAPLDMRVARKRLLSDSSVSDNEKTLLKKVSISLDRNDGMYIPFEAQHYLSVGISAVHCIDLALANSNNKNTVSTILDLPCGYGRVLRFLKAKFPSAVVSASEIEPGALEFCGRTFSVRTVASNRDMSKLSLSGEFDLIWCGSLITHFRAHLVTELLKFFYDHLAPGGCCVLTTHGQASVQKIEENRESYGLTAVARRELLSQFREKGFGYVDYKHYPGYGISIVSYEQMLTIAHGVAPWCATSFLEQGWDKHQDVYGFTKPT